MILAGTRDGFQPIDVGGERAPRGHQMRFGLFDGESIWAISNGSNIWRHHLGGNGEIVASIDDAAVHCLLPIDDGLLVGTSEAALHRLVGGKLKRLESFDATPGRAAWHTPWGGPPDVRSMAIDSAGNILVNVHVGGVVRSTDGGTTWQDTMDIHADVHEVVTHPTRPGWAFAATARGLAWTEDGAASWRFSTDGLHAGYCRAVAATESRVYLSVATGSGGGRAAVYRRSIEEDGPFERCAKGLPEWFSTNVNTGCLRASGAVVVVGDENGSVFISDDEGESWRQEASGLPGVYCVVIIDENEPPGAE